MERKGRILWATAKGQDGNCWHTMDFVKLSSWCTQTFSQPATEFPEFILVDIQLTATQLSKLLKQKENQNKKRKNPHQTDFKINRKNVNEHQFNGQCQDTQRQKVSG